MNILKYLSLAIEIGAAVESVTTLIDAAEAIHSPITGAQLEAAIQPVILGIQSIWPKVTFPEPLVTDIVNTAADAINKYVLGLAQKPTA